jgi:hypothetical protein
VSNAAQLSAKLHGPRALGSLAPVRSAGDYSDREFARMAIEEARKSVAKDDSRVHPKVGQ